MSQSSAYLQRLKDLLADAIELPREQRGALLETVRQENAALASELQRMLAAHEAATLAGGFLSDPTIDPSKPTAPRRFGPFTLIKLIGEGGFGEVYLAEQSSPIQRQVALKLIKPGMDSGQIMARFDAERQALAIMDHPNIARVFDAGTDERGRPWFAMEYVDGDPIHTFADKHRLDVRARLELLVPVCRAVHHAHQKGVIHRDLKPSNVLVSKIDGRAVPKVIDFGIAKALDRPLTEKTIFSELRSLVGTPEYMSPEQADLSGGDIDTRSDVYSLGVLLYELLVGATPFDGRELRSRAFGEIQRILREVDPPTPSTRFSRLEMRASAAANRNIEPAKLSSALRGELDWITMKCLEKDRARRYDTAAELADELVRYLENQPVHAGPVSKAYRAKKFVRRHRLGVIASGLVAAALVIGAAGMIWGSIQARRQRDQAILAREQAEQSRVAAETARVAESQAKLIAEEHNQFLREMFESIDPSTALGKEISVKHVLDTATFKIDSQPPKDPKVEASLRATFGRAYAALGQLDVARKHLDRARVLGDNSIDTEHALIKVMRDQGQYDAARQLAQHAIDAERLLSGDESVRVLSSQVALASIHLAQDNQGDAETILKTVIQRGRKIAATQPAVASSLLIDALATLGNLYIGDGRFDDADQCLSDAMEIARTGGEKETTSLLTLAATRGDLYRHRGRFQEAMDLLVPTLESARKVWGPDHSDTQSVANNLALVLSTIGRLDEAEALYDDVISRRMRILGEDHPRTLLARSNRGLVYQQQNRLDLAAKEFADLSTRFARVLGPDHVDSMVAENNYATVLTRMGRLDEAETVFRRLVERSRVVHGEKSLPFTSLTLRYAHVLSLKRDFPAAEPLFAQAFANAETMGVADVQSGFALGYGLCLSELGKAAEAVQILSRADAALRRMPAPDPTSLQKIAEAMVRSYTQLGNAEEVARWQAVLQAATTQPTSQPAR